MRHRQNIKGKVVLLVLMMVLTFTLAGCAPASNDLMRNIKPAAPIEAVNPPDPAFIKSISDFTWHLMQASLEKEDNVMLSPASVYLALAMTLNGADTGTRDAMLKALAAEGIDLEALNASARDYYRALIMSKDGYDLNISNSIWFREGFQADEAFLQKNADAYTASIRSLDFSSPDAVKAINGWVDDATEGTIEKIVEKIDPNVIMYIINAIYFKADWLVPFSASSTYAQPFMTPAGSIDADFMHKLLSVETLESEGSRGLLLPYVDPRFAFMALLPEEGKSPADWIRVQTSEDFKAMLETRKSSSVELALPKFETRYEDGLIDELEALGMGVAFDSGQADFSLMQTSRERNLYISAVQHKTFIRVDELGTEAAAVTSVEVSVTSMPISDEQMVFDRPFVYGIIDLETGLPIFLGVMNDPTQ